MKAFIKSLLLVILSPVISLFYNDIWILKDKIHKSGRFKYIYEKIYYSKLQKYGGWIGAYSDFADIPVLPHGPMSIFVSNAAKIGRNCIIYQQVTIGSNTLEGSKGFGSPTIGDNVLIGAGAKIIGNVHVGNNCRIGANAVVVKDIPDNTIVVPQVHLILKEQDLDNTLVPFRLDLFSPTK